VRRSPIVLVLIGIASVQIGAAIAKTLFDDYSPTSIVWLRLLSSAVVLLVVARPRLRGRTRADLLVVLAFGAALGLMNWSIYQAFARIPLGLAVTIEFAGPLAIALAGTRRLRDLTWVVLAGAGVVLLGVTPGALTLAGVGFALLAAATWAAYILLSRRTGASWPGVEGLAVASAVAVVLLTPVTLARYGGELSSGRIWLLGAAVGVLSSVIPYSCEITALRRLPPATFGILMSLEPAAAALAGLVVVGEHLGVTEWIAIACVVAASVGATRRVPAAPVPD
jgi:inner membrane transporter RhtA